MHKIVVGLGFGDESKGATVDWLCATNDITAVVRFNGGPQAAHNVVTPDGRHHTFAQFGSGTFHGVPTYLSKFMLVNPFNLVREAEHLVDLGVEDPLDTVLIDGDALLVTPYHRHANRLREDVRGASRHGSTGQGVGETRAYAIERPDLAPVMSDLYDEQRLAHKLYALLGYYIEEFGFSFMDDLDAPSKLASTYYSMVGMLHIVTSGHLDAMLDAGDCVFEGAQGVLLDELVGFNPHTTWTKTTQENARTLLAGRPAEVYGLTRTYHTRHGAGPFPTEYANNNGYDEPHNGEGRYQGGWRVGALDLSLLRYAVHVNGGIDHLVVSHVDYLESAAQTHRPFEWTAGYTHADGNGYKWLYDSEVIGAPFTLEQSVALGEELSRMVPDTGGYLTTVEALDTAMEFATGVRPSVYSYGPTWKDKRVADVPAVR